MTPSLEILFIVATFLSVKLTIVIAQETEHPIFYPVALTIAFADWFWFGLQLGGGQ